MRDADGAAAALAGTIGASGTAIEVLAADDASASLIGAGAPGAAVAFIAGSADAVAGIAEAGAAEGAGITGPLPVSSAEVTVGLSVPAAELDAVAGCATTVPPG